MNLRTIVSGVILLLAACGAIAWIEHVPKRPAEGLQFVHPDLWLGNVTREQSVPFTFELRNESDQPVRIVSAEGSCRCVTLRSAPTEIPKRSSGLFKWTFSGARSSGLEDKEIVIETADGKSLVGKFHVWVEDPDAKSGGPRSDS